MAKVFRTSSSCFDTLMLDDISTTSTIFELLMNGERAFPSLPIKVSANLIWFILFFIDFSLEIRFYERTIYLVSIGDIWIPVIAFGKLATLRCCWSSSDRATKYKISRLIQSSGSASRFLRSSILSSVDIRFIRLFPFLIIFLVYFLERLIRSFGTLTRSLRSLVRWSCIFQKINYRIKFL